MLDDPTVSVSVVIEVMEVVVVAVAVAVGVVVEESELAALSDDAFEALVDPDESSLEHARMKMIGMSEWICRILSLSSYWMAPLRKCSSPVHWLLSR